MSITISGSGAITGASTSYSFDQAVSVAGTVTYEDVSSVDSVGIITAQSGIHVTSGSVGIGTDNPGQLLTVGAIAGGADGNLSVKTNTNNHAIAIEENSGNENYQLGVNSSGDLGFYNSGATVATVTFDDSGNVGIGTDNPTVLLDLESNTPIIRLTDANASGTPECQVSGAGGDLILDADRDDGKSDSHIRFQVDGTERLRITSDGDVNVATGGSVFLANGNLVFSTSGTGIDFSATSNGSGTVSSEILNDYEEGTWTVTAVNYSGTLTVNSASYVKVGDLCFVHGYVSFSNTDDSSNLILDGLPFTGFGANNNYYVISSHTNGGLDNLALRAQGTTTELTAVHLSSGDGDSKPSFTSLKNKFIIFSGCFKTT